MRKIAIVTDTTAGILPEQVAQYDIEIVPVALIFENKSYRDGIDITRARFDCAELFITEFTPIMGVHTRPGLVGVAFYCE